MKTSLRLERGVSAPLPYDATGLVIAGVNPQFHARDTRGYFLERCTDRKWRVFSRRADNAVNTLDGLIVPNRVDVVLLDHSS